MEAVSFEDDGHPNLLLEELKSMMDNELLVDVVVCVQESRIPCHRNVLAATSPYFKAMFTLDLNESRMRQVPLYEVDAKAVTLLIEYAYTGKLRITRENVQNVLSAASLFQILPVIKACAKFLEQQLDVNNCIGMNHFAQMHDCEDLMTKAKEFIEKNFRDVCKTEEFLALNLDKLIGFVSSDELNVEKEEEVYEAIMAWTCYDVERRKGFLGDLLPHVRLGLVQMKYIEDQINQNKLVQRCPRCLKLLSNLNAFECDPEHYRGEFTFNLQLRSGMIQPETCVLFIGGINEKKPILNCYNPLTREAFLMATFPDIAGRSGYYCVEYPAVTIADENVVYVGGGNYVYHEENYGELLSEDDSIDEFDEEESVRKDFFMYDNDHNVWIPKAPMLFPRSNFSLAYVDGRIYSFGGLTLNQQPMEIIECYDMDRNQWSYVGMLQPTFTDLRTVAFRDEIYLLGGRSGVRAFNSVRKFDPKKQEWTNLASMPTPRFNFGACVFENEIMVAGGQMYTHMPHSFMDGANAGTIHRHALRSTEIFNIQDNQWRMGPDLPEEMYNVSLMKINGTIYASGMTEYQRSPFRIYRYNVVCRLDIVKNQWQQIESDLCNIRNYACTTARLHTRKLSQVFRPEVDT